MAKRPRRNNTAAFQAKVVLKAIKEEQIQTVGGQAPITYYI